MQTTGCVDGKGVDNLSIPFGQLGITTANLVEIIGGISSAGERRDHVDDNKPPFVFVERLANFLLLKEGDFGFHRSVELQPLRYFAASMAWLNFSKSR